MKTSSATLLLLTLVALITPGLNQRGAAQAQSQKETKPEDILKKAEDAPRPDAAVSKPLPEDPEERFKILFTKASLSGRWAPLKDGVLGEERPGDKYEIVNVVKGGGDNWTV